MLSKKNIIIISSILLIALIIGYIMSKFKNISKELPNNGTYPIRKNSEIDRIVVHHSAGSSSATPYDFARWHINDHNWPGIAYHYYISENGEILQTQALKYATYHAGKEANQHGISIVLPGNFNNSEPTAKQLRSLDQLINILRLRFGKLPVAGHKDYQSTSCPGTSLYQYIQKFK
jgi:N-acetyl-anhydromuramyl-L-alanine amidase AmpD